MSRICPPAAAIMALIASLDTALALPSESWKITDSVPRKRKRLISLIKKVNAFFAQLKMNVAGSLPGRGILSREAQGAPNGVDERTPVVEATTKLARRRMRTAIDGRLFRPLHAAVGRR
jgi:hypothetical protein